VPTIKIKGPAGITACRPFFCLFAWNRPSGAGIQGFDPAAFFGTFLFALSTKIPSDWKERPARSAFTHVIFQMRLPWPARINILRF